MLFGAFLFKMYFTDFYWCVFICGRQLYLDIRFIALYYIFKLIFCHLYVNK